MGAGIINASSISGSLDAKNIAIGVLKKQIEVSNLVDLCQPVDVPELTATIPIQSIMEGAEDLGDWEWSKIEGSDFTNVDFDLKKDRIKIGVSDEAKYKSRAGDPLALQISAGAMRLANILDKKIVTAMQTSPQTAATSAIWSTVTNNPLRDLAKACAGIRPYKADFVIMPSAVWSAFVGNDYTSKFAEGNPDALSKATAIVPGLGLKVYINENVTAKSILVGCSGAPGCAVGNGPVEVRSFDSERGGRIYQMDVWRQAKAPILKNASNLNMGVYQVTAVIA
jgi:hypothetical protein